MSNAPWNSDTREKAISYLSKGIAPGNVAEALGVSASAISNLLSEDEFRETLAAKRFELSEKQNRHDDNLDDLEASLIASAKQSIAMITRPLEILRAASIINAMKRRGAQAPDSQNASPVVLNLVLPQAIMSRFTLNSHNQVIAAGDQELVTIQSHKVADLVAEKIPSQSRENQYAHNSLRERPPEVDQGISSQKRTTDIEVAKVKYERIDEFGFDYQNQSL